jgi:hypothetical protein
MKNRVLVGEVVLFALVNIAIGIGSVILSSMNGADWRSILSDGGWILALSMTSIAILITILRPNNPLGWIFFAVGFFQGLVSFAFQYATYTLVTSPGALPGGPLMSWLGQLVWFPGLCLMLTYAVLLFPTGHLPSRRWRIFAWICVIPMVLFVPLALSVWPYRGLELLLHPDSITPSTGILSIFLNLSFPMVLVCGIVSLASLVIRYRKADLVVRRQIKWVAFAAGIFLLMELLQAVTPVYNFFTDNKLTYLVAVPVSIALPAAIGMAILRYRLWEIDILINRTLVYIPLTGILSGLYAASTSLLQRLFVAITGTKSDGAIVLTTLILASTFTPIKNALQAFVDRRFKNPLEPLASLKTFKRQVQAVEQVVDRESAARRFLDESTAALQASCGAVLLSHNGSSQVVSVTGDWEIGRETLTIPIGVEANNVGTLYLGRRGDGTAYTEPEISLLHGVAESLGRVLSVMDAA